MCADVYVCACKRELVYMCVSMCASTCIYVRDVCVCVYVQCYAYTRMSPCYSAYEPVHGRECGVSVFMRVRGLVSAMRSVRACQPSAWV